MTNDKFTAFKDVIGKTARFVVKDFPEVEYEDLFQDLALYVLKNDKLTDPDVTGMSTHLYRKAVELSWEYRKDALTISPQYSYRTSDVKRVLATLFNPDDWDSAYIPEDMRSEDVFGDHVAFHTDVKVAYDELPLWMRKVIFKKFALLEDVDASNLAKSVTRLVDILNFYTGKAHEGPGKRKAVNNATARYIIDSAWDGEERSW